MHTPVGERGNTFVELIRRSCVDKITLTHESVCYIDYLTQEEKTRTSFSGHFHYIRNTVLPTLRKGSNDYDIAKILMNAPGVLLRVP